MKGPNLTAIDPAGREIVILFNPRGDSWFDHFPYQDAYVMGMTPTGRATISLLEMNDPERRRNVHVASCFAVVKVKD